MSFEEDREILSNSTYLNDNIIHAAQILLKKLPSVSSEGIGGFQSPQCGKELSFKHVMKFQKCIQVLHINNNHYF